MKKIFRSVAALAVVLFAGCTNDIDTEVNAPVIGGETVVSVGIADTKTYLGDLVDGARKVYWDAEDQIAINGVASTQTTLNEEKTVAEFLFPVALQTPYSALYPAKAYVDAQTINLPAHQGRGLENVDNNALPMAGYAAEDGVVTLHHLAGAVKYQISYGDKTTDKHSIRRIELWGNNNEQMAGDFVIDYQSATLTAAGTNAESKVVVEIDKDQNESGIVTVYAVLPAIEYTKGITVRLIDKAGHYMDLASKAMTIEKGEIKAMPAVEFVPTGTIVDAEISIASAAEWNAFVKEYNADKYEGVVVSVKFTQDIVFDDATNAEFETIEASNGYFAGVVDGQNFSIKGLKSVNKPIFNSISGTTIKNLVVDASCEWTYTGITLEENTWFGTLAVDIFSSTVENVTFNGKSTYDAITANGLNLTVYTGNIFGRTNAQCIMKNCVNNGSLETLGTCNFGIKSDGKAPGGTVYSGGLVGYSRCPMENCTNNGAITQNWSANTKATGGVIGRITGTGALVNCVNTGTITDNSLRTPEDAGSAVYDYNRNLYVGGIVGLPACDVTNCSNSGAVIANSDIKSVWAGGVIAFTNSDVGNYNGLTNTGNITSNGAARYVKIGGVIGYTKSTGIHANLNNSGAVTVNKLEGNDGATEDLGGIIGHADAVLTLDGTSAYNIVNKGNVTHNFNVTKYKYMAVGGIVGSLQKLGTVKNAKNENPVQVLSNASSNVNVTTYCGGIVGVAAVAGSVIENCTNSAMVYNRIRGTGYYDDTAMPLVAANGYHVGGIVGFMHGENGTTSTIKNCHNTCTLAHTANNSAGVVANRGYTGGVVAYAKYTNISDCSSCATMLGVNTNVRLGGIAAYLDNSHITGCSVTSPELYSYNNTFIGGIASGVNAGSSIKNSTFNGTIAAEGAILTCKAVASFTKAGAVIENCGVAGSVLDTALTAENYAEHIVGDTNTTPTGCYLLTE